jgi:hypothetical protein
MAANAVWTRNAPYRWGIPSVSKRANLEAYSCYLAQTHVSEGDMWGRKEGKENAPWDGQIQSTRENCLHLLWKSANGCTGGVVSKTCDVHAQYAQACELWYESMHELPWTSAQCPDRVCVGEDARVKIVRRLRKGSDRHHSRRVFTEIKVNRAENTTKSNVAMEGRYEKPRALTLPSSSPLHTMQDPYCYTRASHVPADRVIEFVEGGWERSVANVDTNAYFSTHAQISPSRLRPRRLIQLQHTGAWMTLLMRQLVICT